MYLSPDVGSRAPRGLAWGLSAREQDRESPVTVLVANSGGKQATEEWLFVDLAELPLQHSELFQHWDIRLDVWIVFLFNMLINFCHKVVDNSKYFKWKFLAVNLWSHFTSYQWNVFIYHCKYQRQQQLFN